MLHFDMNLYYVNLESCILMSSFVFSLALCVVFILSLYLCYSVYLIFTTIILFQSVQYATSSMSTSVSGCLPFCVKLVFCYYCLLSLWGNKYDDDDDDDDSYSLSKGRLVACFLESFDVRSGP